MEIRKDTVVEVLSQVPIFAQIETSEVHRLASAFMPLVYQDGEVVFDIGDESEAMYVIYEGQVALSHDPSDGENLIAKLSSGDFFGEEALLYDDPRYYRAVASGMTVVLTLDIDHFITIYDALPNVEDMLEVAISSRQLSMQVSLPWLHEDEYVYVMTRRHSAILWSKLVAPIVTGLAAMLLGGLLQGLWQPDSAYGWITLGVGLPVSLLWLVWTFVDWQNDYFIVTNKRVVWIEKIAMIYESRQEAPLRTIMSVGIHRSRVGTMLGYGDVVVTTYVGTIRLREIAYTEVTAQMVESYWHRSKSFNRREEARMMARKLEEKLDLPSEDDDDPALAVTAQSQEETSPTGKEPGFLAWLFSDFIRLRYEKDGIITYRKHWFVLISHMWLPALLLALTIVAMIMRLAGRWAFLPITEGLVLLILLMFAVFLWMLYVYADWRNDVFMVTLNQIIDLDRKPLGKVRRRSAPLENVLSIEYERLGLWGFLFNFGTVYIVVGNSRLSFDHVYNPSEVQEDIFYRMGERLDKVRQFEIDAERERVSEWIASYHRKTSTAQPTRRHRIDRNN